jgi:AcrR family transcriptional regulator
MAASPPVRLRRARRKPALPSSDSRFDQRLGQILEHATEVFCDKGYAGASMRDLSRATGMSLAGLYYYFESKERLLYLIQKHTFATVLEKLKARLEGLTDSEERIRVFILNHLEFFLVNQQGMKVLAHEDEVLTNSLGAEIAGLKREYYRLAVAQMEALKRARGLDFNSRTAVMSLFGMMNWIYTWYNPRVDGDAPQIAHEMGDIFLSGVTGQHPGRNKT